MMMMMMMTIIIIIITITTTTITLSVCYFAHVCPFHWYVHYFGLAKYCTLHYAVI